MGVTLYLLNKKGFKVLQTIIHKYPKIIDTVIGAKDAGNFEDFYDEISSLCHKNNIIFKDRKDDFINKSNYSLAIGWRWLINDIKKLIVIHDSWLPYYRGFSPLVNMLINGEQYVAASAIFANDKMDAGDLLLQKRKTITYPIKINEAIDQVSELYSEIADDLAKQIVDGKILKGEKQDHLNATYSVWRDEMDYFIDWNKTSEEIIRFVNAVGYPFNGAMARTNEDELIYIRECASVDINVENNAPGKLLMYDDGCPVILCGKNAVKLLVIENIQGEPFIFKKFRSRLK